MRTLAACGVLLLAAAPSFAADGPKACEELKAEIAKKLEAKGVQSYTLEIVEQSKEAEGKVVGTCEGGTKKIMYQRTTKSAEPAPAKK